eukprot:g5285.t1
MNGKLTRREFATDVAALIAGGALIVPAAAASARPARKQKARQMEKACNFQSSFMTWDFPYQKDPRPHARHNIPHGNLARIDLDALIDVIDDATGKSERFVLIAPCRTEWVYAENRLFQIPSSEYRNIYSTTEERAVRRSITDDGTPSKGHPVKDTFRSLKIDIKTWPQTRVLKTPAEIVKATADNITLIGRTEVPEPGTKRRFVLQYPIRTMNFQPKTNSFQVDTGPLLMPDFKVKEEKSIDRLEMAFIAYNRLDRAEFLIRRPTPVKGEDGKELCKTVQFVKSDTDETVTFVSASRSHSDLPEGEDRVSRFGDYELIEEIARGGMGIVFKATQISLNRVVALKTIKSGELAGKAEMQRFRAEAEAAAGLDHPNIVPIYEVGEQNGQQFFSMGFVDGQGLDARLKAGPLPPREAVELIRTISEAVQYAHDNGVIHRDLKPANVLIDSDGKPRITDFGLAKNIATDSGMTTTGQIIGTPSFMPPEQAAGKSAEIGPLADVYSLGAMLYALLTGRPPFQAANVMETLKQVLEQEPVSPRVINPAVDQDLETICLKCLRKEPDNRYGAADELAHELDRFLKDKPILARPVKRVERAWRWCRRNPLGATIAALVSLILVASPVVAAIQIQLKRAANESARIALETQERLKEETKRANTQATNAKRERDTAVRLARKLETSRASLKAAVDKYVDAVLEDEILADLKHQALRKKLLADALLNYKSYIRNHEHDEQSLAEIHDALGRIADISRRTGFEADTLAVYRQGLEVLQRLVRENPSASKYRRALAFCYDSIGGLHRAMGRLNDASAAFQQALAIFQQLMDENPNVPEFRRGLGRTQTNIGMLYFENRQYAKAEIPLRKALEIRHEVMKQTRTVAKDQSNLATSHYNLGVLYARLRRAPEALAAISNARTILKRLTEESPATNSYQVRLAAANDVLGVIYEQIGKPLEALAAHQRAVRILKALVHKSPTITDYSGRLAASLNNIGLLQQMMKNPNEALKGYEESLEIHMRLASENPKILRYRLRLGHAHVNIGSFYRATRKPAAALTAFQQAATIFERLATESPKAADHHESHAVSLNNIGILFLQYRNSVDASIAKKSLQRAYRIRERLAKADPEATQIQVGLAGTCVNLANTMSLTREIGAIDLLNKAISILESVLKREPRHQLASRFRLNAYRVRAKLNDSLHRYQAAIADWRQVQQLETGRSRFYAQRRLCLSMAHAGQYDEAMTLCVKLSRVIRQAPAAYDLACVCALCADAAARDKSKSAENRERTVTHLVTVAMAFLKSLARSGYFDVSQNQGLLQTDRDLHALRHRRDFREFARSVGVELPAWAKRPRSADLPNDPTRAGEFQQK